MIMLLPSAAACQCELPQYPSIPDRVEYAQYSNFEQPDELNSVEFKPVGLKKAEGGVYLDLLVIGESAESWAYQIGGVHAMNDTELPLIVLVSKHDHKKVPAYCVQRKKPYRRASQWNPLGSAPYVGARQYATPPLVLTPTVAIERIAFRTSEEISPGEYEVRLTDEWREVISGKSGGGEVFRNAQATRSFRVEQGPCTLQVQ